MDDFGLYIKEWLSNNCKPLSEVEHIKAVTTANAMSVLSRIDGKEITEKPIIFDSNEFDSMESFSRALFIMAEKYKDNDEIIVRYVKKVSDEDIFDVYFRFHIFKEKKKSKNEDEDFLRCAEA